MILLLKVLPQSPAEVGAALRGQDLGVLSLGELLSVFNAKRQPLHPAWALLCRFLQAASQLKLSSSFQSPIYQQTCENFTI